MKELDECFLKFLERTQAGAGRWLQVEFGFQMHIHQRARQWDSRGSEDAWGKGVGEDAESGQSSQKNKGAEGN